MPLSRRMGQGAERHIAVFFFYSPPTTPPGMGRRQPAGWTGCAPGVYSDGKVTTTPRGKRNIGVVYNEDTTHRSPTKQRRVQSEARPGNGVGGGNAREGFDFGDLENNGLRDNYGEEIHMPDLFSRATRHSGKVSNRISNRYGPI